MRKVADLSEVAGFYTYIVTDPSSKERKLLDVEVSLNGEPFGKRAAIERLWEKEIPHAIVKGQGGMGKTVTLLQLWKQYIDEDGPLPLFIILNEYNQAQPEEQADWIMHYILHNYLDEQVPTQENKNLLSQWLKADHHSEHPKVLLLLDGFNEITIDYTQLIISLQKDWREACQGIQILLTSRYESNLTWTTDFQHFDLLPLKPKQIKAYLEGLGQAMPQNAFLSEVLSNPMMLTIYAASNEVIEKYRNHPALNFKESVSSRAELLWNFLEAQLAKQGEVIIFHEEKIGLYRWLLDHLLPWMGYNMEVLGKFDVDRWELEDSLKAYIEHIASAGGHGIPSQEKNSIFRTYARLFPSCTRNWHQLVKKKGYEVELWIRMLEKELKLITQNERENYIFRHQDFRDYFAAKHILNEIQLGPRPKGISILYE